MSLLSTLTSDDFSPIHLSTSSPSPSSPNQQQTTTVVLPPPTSASQYYRLAHLSPHVSASMFEMVLNSVVDYCVSSSSSSPSRSRSALNSKSGESSSGDGDGGNDRRDEEAEENLSKIEKNGYEVGYRIIERMTVNSLTTVPRGVSAHELEGCDGVNQYDREVYRRNKLENKMENMRLKSNPNNLVKDNTTLTQNPTYTINPAIHLEIIKYISKDLWNSLFSKQIDKLQTNHKGTFVLRDYDFAWVRKLPYPSSNNSNSNSKEKEKERDEKTRLRALQILQYPCGIIRGALANFGVSAVVSCDFYTDAGSSSGGSWGNVCFNIRI